MHLSKTKINLFRRCPYAFYCRYILNLKIPPASAMFLGRCFDDAINFNYIHKIEKGKDEKVSAVKDYFNDSFKAGKDEVQFEPDEKPAELKDKGILTTDCFHRNICTKVKPKQVQIADEITFKNVKYTMKVVVDLLTQSGIIVDNKYTGKTWVEGKEHGELDPVIYSIWYQQKFGKPAEGFRFDIGIGTKTPKTDQREVFVTAENIAGFLKYLAVINDEIEHSMVRGLFLPRTDNFLCSKRRCGYHLKCSQEWKHTIKD